MKRKKKKKMLTITIYSHFCDRPQDENKQEKNLYWIASNLDTCV